jgi:hypothetical protein
MLGPALPHACLSCQAHVPCKASLLHAFLSPNAPYLIDLPKIAVLHTFHHPPARCIDILRQEWHFQVPHVCSQICWSTNAEDASAYVQLILYGSQEPGVHGTPHNPIENVLPLSATLLLSDNFRTAKLFQRPCQSTISYTDMHIPVPIVAQLSGHQMLSCASKQGSFPCFPPLDALEDPEHDSLTQLSCQLIAGQLCAPDEEMTGLNISLYKTLAPFLLSNLRPQRASLPSSCDWHKLPEPLVPNMTDNFCASKEDQSNVICSLLDMHGRLEDRSGSFGLHNWLDGESVPECKAKSFIAEACGETMVHRKHDCCLVTVALQYDTKNAHISVQLSLSSKAKLPVHFPGVFPKRFDDFFFLFFFFFRV